MGYNYDYDLVKWYNYPSKESPLDADNLNKMDMAIMRHNDALMQQGYDIDKLDSDMSDLKSTISSYSGAISDLQDRTSSVEGRLNRDETRISTLEDEIEHMDIKTSFSELKDVQLTDLQDGDVPVYDATLQKWVNGVADMGLFVENGILMCRYTD